MDGINEVMLLGTVGKDPEIRFLNDSKRVASFSLATNKSYKEKATGLKKESTEWHFIEVWDFQADFANTYIKKGTNLWLRGEIKTETWDDTTSGTKKSRTKIVADKLQLLPGGVRADGTNGSANGQPYSQPAYQQGNQQPAQGNQQPAQGYQQPIQPPVQGYQPPIQPPVQGYQPPIQPPVQGYQPPVQGNQQPIQPPVQGYQPPVQGYQAAQNQTAEYVNSNQFNAGLNASGQPDDLPF